MNKVDAKMGGSMVYVVILITFLGILSTGFLYMTEYSRRSVMNNRAYIEAQTAARGIHQSFCEAVSGKTSEAMDMLWACFKEDCEAAREEYERLDADKNGGDEERPEAGGGPLTEEDGGTGSEDPGEAGDNASPWEAFLRHRLEEKAYVARGSTDLPGPVSVSMTLSAFPMKSKATVSTTVVCNGYSFSMNGDILFNNPDGGMMDLGQGLFICIQGSGVCRYYGD